MPSGLSKIHYCQNSNPTVPSFITNGVLLSWRFCKELSVEIWMLSTFFVVTVFIREFDKKASHAFFGSFWKKLLQSVTESSTSLKVIVTKCNKKIITKYDNYCKLRQNLWQSVTGISKCDKRLLEKCDTYH